MFRRRHVDSAHALSRNSTHLPNEPVDFACFVLASGQFWIVEYSRIVYSSLHGFENWFVMSKRGFDKFSCQVCRSVVAAGRCFRPESKDQNQETKSNHLKHLKTSIKNQRWIVEGFILHSEICNFILKLIYIYWRNFPSSFTMWRHLKWIPTHLHGRQIQIACSLGFESV